MLEFLVLFLMSDVIKAKHQMIGWLLFSGCSVLVSVYLVLMCIEREKSSSGTVLGSKQLFKDSLNSTISGCILLDFMIMLLAILMMKP